MKQFKTVRVGNRTQVGTKTYLANTYVLPADEADALIEAGGSEMKPPARSVKAAEAKTTKTAQK